MLVKLTQLLLIKFLISIFNSDLKFTWKNDFKIYNFKNQINSLVNFINYFKIELNIQIPK